MWEQGRDFLLGLIGVAAIGLLVAALLLPVLLMGANYEIAYIDVNRPIAVSSNQDSN